MPSDSTELSRPSLDTLPTEIIYQIVGLGTCESVLALQRVCRKLYQICNDHNIFKNIIIDSDHAFCTNTEMSWQNVDLSSESSVSSWARYALACSKVARLIPMGLVEAMDQCSSPTIADYVPQLFASNRLYSPNPFMELQSQLSQQIHLLKISRSCLSFWKNLKTLTRI